jgi:hypothetical protein
LFEEPEAHEAEEDHGEEHRDLAAHGGLGVAEEVTGDVSGDPEAVDVANHNEEDLHDPKWGGYTSILFALINMARCQSKALTQYSPHIALGKGIRHRRISPETRIDYQIFALVLPELNLGLLHS